MGISNKKSFIVLPLIILMQLVFISLPKAYAYSNPAAVSLLTVDHFAALAKSTITSPTGPTVLNNGDMGLDSPAVCTGFISPCTGSITGTINNGTIQYQNAVALQGQTDATAVVADIAGRSSDETIAGGLLGGLVLNQGVYTIPEAVTNLTGDLTLNGDADSVFIFHATSSLITANGSRVLLTGGAQSCHVFWKVDSSATFNGTTTMVGTVLALASVTFPGGGATLDGRAIARTAAITLNNTKINNSACAGSTPGGTPATVNASNSNTFKEDTRCIATTPLAPQWALRSPTEGGVNLSWSAVGGSQVDIEITNDKGVYEYRYAKVSNTGHMFLPNVTSGQMIRIRVFNECEYGDWLIASATPGLPNTGFAPHLMQ